VAWVANARQALMATRHLPDEAFLDRHLTIFHDLARHISKFPIFASLSEEDIKQVTDQLVYGWFDDGHVFFRRVRRRSACSCSNPGRWNCSILVSHVCVPS